MIIPEEMRGAACFCVLALTVAPSASVVINGRHQTRQHYQPQYAKLGPNQDIETIWQRPRGGVRGILFLAHGSKHQATDFFSEVGQGDDWRFEACAISNYGSCLGLPEQVLMRQTARKRGYLVAAVSGGSGAQSHWYPDKDPARVRLALEHIRAVEGLGEVPLLLSGSSSGGEILGELLWEQLPHLSCVIPMNARLSSWPAPLSGVAVLFQQMVRDAQLAEAVRSSFAELRAQGVRAALLEVHPAPVTVELLTREGFGLEREAATEVVAALRAGGFLDPEGFLLEDPRKSKWRKVVGTRLAVAAGGVGADKSMLSELLNVAYARHESFGGHMNRALDFCEGSVVT